MANLLSKIKSFNLVKSKKNRTFATDDEPTALATDVGKETPILRGSDAKRFIENMKKAEKNASAPKSKEQIKKDLDCRLLLRDLRKRELEELEQEIKVIEAKLKKLNGETEEE